MEYFTYRWVISIYSVSRKADLLTILADYARVFWY